MGLSREQIEKLYATKRTKGIYEDKLNILMNESNDEGIDPKESWPMDFPADKNATTLYQGFRNAAEKMEIADQIDVIQREGSVFILVKSRVALMLGADETPEVEGDESTEDNSSDESTEAPEVESGVELVTA